MSRRLPQGGRLIEREKPLRFTFDGRRYSGFKGDTLASALMANGQKIIGRSFKFHRPRGLVASGPEEPNALVGLGKGSRKEPNQVATMAELFDGLVAESQNCWPGLNFDVGALGDKFSRLLPAGFYYKTFMSPGFGWHRIFEPAIRRMAGLGKPPELSDSDRYEHFHAHADILVVGGGIAGLTAARVAAASGVCVIVVEQTPNWGGRSAADSVRLDGEPAANWVRSTVGELENAGAAMRLRTTALGVYSHGYALACERLTDHEPVKVGTRHRLWFIRAKKIIVAAGAVERPLVCPGNDIPGVMLASAVRDYLSEFGVAAGREIVVVANNDDAYRTALALSDAGITVPAILDTRSSANRSLPALARDKGLRVMESSGIAQIFGGKQVKGVAVCAIDGSRGADEKIGCDAVALSGGWSPSVHLWSHSGGKLCWDEAGVFFGPDPNRPPTGDDGVAVAYAAGAANGELFCRNIAFDAERASKSALADLGVDPASLSIPIIESGCVTEAGAEPAWLVPKTMNPADRARSWVDFQNDVKVSDIELAALEGYESVEHAKRYTTLGMATDQGKLSNVNGLAILADRLGAKIPDVGTTTFRPPFVPVAFGAIAGEGAGELFKPVRKTPMHAWHDENGAFWEPVGDWRRPFCYLRGNESDTDAVLREVLCTRRGVGLLDGSTLGKILVAGPDAGRFLDMLYTGVMSNLPIGKCKYGLMCNENGFLMDDGVVARIDSESFLCHTTTGGADSVHAWMESWLQTEWWDWHADVYNLTEQYAQIVVAGPKARDLLQKMGGMDLSAESLPFMHWREGRIGEFNTRVFRISFSGELSFELAVRARDGLALWQVLVDAGAEFGAAPYGTECMHVMRAEKGFIMIGDETDGTVTPLDLELNWAISKKKGDFIGKRALERPYQNRSSRWRLVGLELPRFKSKDSLEDGVYLYERNAVNAHGHTKTIGRVTSSYFSPTLDRPIALALVERGPDRMGECIAVNSKDNGNDIMAKIASPDFLDREGIRRNA